MIGDIILFLKNGGSKILLVTMSMYIKKLAESILKSAESVEE